MSTCEQPGLVLSLNCPAMIQVKKKEKKRKTHLVGFASGAKW